MAYAATSSLKQTIQRLLNSSSHISIDSSSREMLDFSYKHLTSLQEVFRKSDERLSSKRLKALEGEIRDALHELEDSLESHASEQFLSSHEDEISSTTLPLELDLKEVWQELNSFAVAVKKMEKDYIQELDQPFPTNDDDDDDDDDDETPSQTTNSDDHVKMVGLSDAFDDLKDHLTRIIRPDEFGFFSFYGKAGIGRSIVAESVYRDVRKEKSFDCGAWVRIGSTYQLKEILLSIISQINEGGLFSWDGGSINHQESLASEGEEKISEYLYSILKGRRYIVGLDDVRGTDILIQLRRSFPEQHNGSLVFVATSLREVAVFDESFFVYEIATHIYEDQIWNYFRMAIFSLEESVSEFEEAGRKIAKNCGGRGLVVARIMLVLLRSNKRRVPEFWKELAAAEHDLIFKVEDEAAEGKIVKEYMREGDEVWANGLLDFSYTIDKIKENLYPERLFPKMGIMTVYGMAGVGKTTLMKKLFEDSSVLNHFDHYAWVNVGLNYQSEKILVDILAQIYKRNMDDDAELATNLCKRLSGKKCLIVLDDLWSQEPVHFLKKFIPNIKGELVVTTRLLKVGMFGPCDRVYKVCLLNKDESWDLLRHKVFGEESNCPRKLENAGKKIAENCEGLPLMILTIADILPKSEKTLEYWNMVATRKNQDFINAQIKVSKSLVPSYETLPQPLKACFLYMGIFPQNDKISASKLMKLWFAEGFLEPNLSQITFEDFVSKCLKDLVDRSMVMVLQKGSDLKTNKTYGIHSVYWHLSNLEAIKCKFFYTILKDNDDTSMQCRKSQRRLCIPNSILLGNKDVYDAMATFSSSRALICSGPTHQYPVPLYLGLKLLGVVDALAIRFYEFPIEAVKLIHLRYLALTCDGQLPSSVAKLWNLQFLIVRQHLSIISSLNSSYLPKEIWDMKEIKHLQIAGNGLPSPDGDALLPNLVSLLDVSGHSCTKRVFEGMPNLKKLGIRVELAPNDNSNPLYCLDNISHLRRLESLKCVVVNPDLGLEVVPRSMFPWSLKKLSLSGLGYPWEYMGTIGKLQNLEVLKLQCYAFVGPAWEIDYWDFSRLKFLSIEDTDLLRWDIKLPSILNLEFLSFKHCYYLEQLPSILPSHVQKIEVVNCNPLSENWAIQMKEKNWKRKMKTLEHQVQSSWND